MKILLRAALIAAIACLAAQTLHAEDSHAAWLRYAPLEGSAHARYDTLPASTYQMGDSAVLKTAQAELIRGLNGMLGRTLRAGSGTPQEAGIVLGTQASLRGAGVDAGPELAPDGYALLRGKVHGFDCIVIAGSNDRGVLYGAFALLSKIARGEDISRLHDRQETPNRIRWVNQWDNMDGSIERGYGGRSIFFDNGEIRSDLARVSEYGRLLASIGINGCAINNVNANPKIIQSDFLPQVARVADTFRPWGVQLVLSASVNFPKVVGGLDTFDPLDPRVAEWWQKKVDEIYKRIPDFAGFVVKADSEGQPGPASYGRTPADAANVIARALKPHGGVVLYRAFVYDHHLDWKNPKNDRARAAYDIFHPLDGKFDDNVVIQIKHGPIDFQAREAISPLFAGLEHTSQALELQITQEYLGQQKHVVFVPSMWKWALDFDLHFKGGATPVKGFVSGKVFHRPTGGFVGVANVGMDTNWLGHPMAMANLYGFGRLAWNPDLSPIAIAEEWTQLTFGTDPLVLKTISSILTTSWRTYENYTGPLGAQTLTPVVGSHYGPGIEASEENGWGQWHRADRQGIGMDRSVATGTGFAGQYPPQVAKMYESLPTTPDDLVLFFHHVPYTYELHSGTTVIQYTYDSHYEGAQEVAEYVRQWEALKHHMDDERYADILRRLEYQAGHAIVWRDAICNYFFRLSGIADAKARVGNHPSRTEAEAMQLKGYTPIDVMPWENASDGKGIECAAAEGCSAWLKFDRPAGWYQLDVQYFDQNNGESKFRVYVGDQLVDEWTADLHLPALKPGGDSSTRRWIKGLALRTGDEIRIEGIPEGQEHAGLDYVEIEPQH